jgi:hypothetical protein
MSELRPPPVPSNDASGAGSVAGDLILRAFGLDARPRETVALSEIKSMLATLGIPAETVERAAAEVREEIAKSVPHTFGGVLHHLFIFSLAALPALWAVDAGLRSDGLSRFAGVGLGVIWLIFCLGGVVDAVYVWATRDRG